MTWREFIAHGRGDGGERIDDLDDDEQAFADALERFGAGIRCAE